VAVTAAEGATTAKVAFPAINATDAVDGSPRIECDGNFNGTKPLVYAPGAEAEFPLGPTPVSCTAVDASGNRSPAGRFTVTVCEAGFTYSTTTSICVGAYPQRRRPAPRLAWLCL
jgi:hypothetical protein